MQDIETKRIALKVTEVAAALGISRSKAYEMAASGELPTVRFGGRVLVPVEALHRKLHELTVVVDGAAPQSTSESARQRS